ncbi:hypothetical protein [Pedobacter jejuensis]|uniref:Uncharacterized protein n=1 Tax=Pedobacter jejuensis TaxID=1268550 RepID=A0A3N0C0F9_9SPHI|nr:hypothetical protein [Pedobacter jejuensis]RNL55759.1 hypothetical protein D7004_03105 [Pedobacter jejuensis]
MENNKKEEEKGKVGVVPAEDITGSDADKAYDENGDFAKPQVDDKDAKKTDTPPGSDADS